MSRTYPRICVAANLTGDRIELDTRAAHYVSHVLRLRAGDGIIVFDGQGTEREASIELMSRQRNVIAGGRFLTPQPPSPTAITLIQGLIKPDRMDLIVQKATELGVSRIVVTRTRYCAVRLSGDRADHKLEHWRRIAISACEQCGRHFPPDVGFSPSIVAAVSTLPAGEPVIVLDHGRSPGALGLGPQLDAVTVVVGPEGGFSEDEIEMLVARDYEFVRLGPRTLRAETAAIVACALAQTRWGDLD